LGNDLKYAINIFENVVVPKTNDVIARCFEQGGALNVTRTFRVLSAIKFDHQSPLSTHEVADEFADRHLAGEFKSFELTISQMLPKPAFCIGGIIAQPLGALRWTRPELRHRTVMPTPSPSRKREGS
jgi:hypothetical protein